MAGGDYVGGQQTVTMGYRYTSFQRSDLSEIRGRYSRCCRNVDGGRGAQLIQHEQWGRQVASQIIAITALVVVEDSSWGCFGGNRAKPAGLRCRLL